MGLKITFSEEEINAHPNDAELGELLRDRLREEIKRLNMTEMNQDLFEKDKCVICGKETPYPKYTHIYNRIGYLEGAGQGCYQPTVCNQK